MKDINRALRKKYFEMLNGNLIINDTAVPVHYKYIPNIIDAPIYVLITTVSNTDISTKQRHMTDTSIQIGIYSKDTIANDGAAVDEIADQIYAIVCPTTLSKIDLMPEFQVVFFNMQSDNSPDAIQTDTSIFVNRFITFSHKVDHRQLPVSI